MGLDSFGVAVTLHEMEPAVALAFGTPLRSRKGLERLAARRGDVGALACWLCSAEAKALEQEELDPKAPVIPTQDAAGRDGAL